jgi:glycosyltransferase involved in cell wall biosynthesis
VWAITRRNNEPAISAALRHTPLPKLRMIYFDVPRPLLACKKGQVGVEMYYRLWQRLTRPLVQDLHRRVRFDLTQHVTFVRYWAPTSLAYLPVPFIWGPVGGGETAPPAFLRDFAFRGRTYETLRHWGQRGSEVMPSVRRAARQAALALAVTRETRARLLALGTERVEVFSAIGLDRAAYESLGQISTRSAPAIRFISMGRLLHWKGFHLGLKAFSAAAVPGSEYWIVGDGPERASLTRLASALGVADKVHFCGAQPRQDALQLLSTAHVLVHPSLHDSGGWVCLEAMAAGKPVICLDLGGPGELVTADTGVKVRADSPEQAVEDLSRAMTLLGSNADLRRTMAQAGRERVRNEYIWEKKGDRLDAFYAAVLNRPAAPAASHA